MEESKNIISGDDVQYYHEALADILLWIDGYIAGKTKGKEHLRNVNIDGLRDLKGRLQKMEWKPTNN